jgi:hypothetical protein
MASSVIFNENKFKELIVYIARRLPPEAVLGRVKLAKLLMQSDFRAYQLLGEPITGATYEKWPQGHLPHELLLAQTDLEGLAISIEQVDYFGKKLKHITALRDPDLSDFSDEEIEVIESVLHEYAYTSATQLSALSHAEVGWRVAKMGEPIPYNTVWLGNGAVTDADFRRAEALASQHGWD